MFPSLQYTEPSMSDTVAEASCVAAQEPAGRRHHQGADDLLILSEIDPLSVIDAPDDQGTPCQLITFGTMRETCPKCTDAHLKLVLRQTHVRAAHLFCSKCNSCFDAHLANG